MSQRRFQVFAPKLAPGQALELVPSPWNTEEVVSLPHEHWDILGSLAAQRKYVRPELWNLMSTLEGQPPEPMEIKMFCTGLKLLQRELRADMTMLAATSRCPEPLPGWEHARMLEAVIRVFEKSGSGADSWIE